jgi:excisionase family DNA binding protein
MSKQTSFHGRVCFVVSEDRRPAMRADFLTRPEAAAYLGVSVSTLARWACLRENVRYHRVGRRALYSRSDLDSFLDRVAIEPVSSKK